MTDGTPHVCVVNAKGMFPEVYGPFPNGKAAAEWALAQTRMKITILPLHSGDTTKAVGES